MNGRAGPRWWAHPSGRQWPMLSSWLQGCFIFLLFIPVHAAEPCQPAHKLWLCRTSYLWYFSRHNGSSVDPTDRVSAQHFLLVSTWAFLSSCSTLLFLLSVYSYWLINGLPVFLLSLPSWMLENVLGQQFPQTDQVAQKVCCKLNKQFS